MSRTPRNSGEEEDKPEEFRNTASSRLLRLKFMGGRQNHEGQWTLTWVADMNGLSLSSHGAAGLHQPFQLVLGDGPHCDHQGAAKASHGGTRHGCLKRNRGKGQLGSNGDSHNTIIKEKMLENRADPDGDPEHRVQGH